MAVVAACIYARISSDDGTALGVARQVADCTAEADRRGWEIVETFIDNDVSASRSAARPQYERMLAAVHAGRVNALVVWDVDRLTRSPRELEDVITFADEHALRLASVGGDIDLSTEQGRLTARLKGSVARYEVEQTSRRLKRKNDELAAAGSPTGKPAFGYTRSRVDGVATDTVNPSEAATIREVAERLLAGEGLWRVAGDLNARGITTNTGGPWFSQTLRRMILRPRNAGLRVHRGKIVGKAAWEPILDRDTFDRLTAMLTDPARKTSNRGTAVRYLMSGIALCGVCGKTMMGTAQRVHKGRNQPSTYKCQNAGCHAVVRSMALVDSVVEGAIVGRLVADGMRLLGGDPDLEQQARARIDALEAKLEIAADQFAADAITAEQLGRITARQTSQALRLPRPGGSLTSKPVGHSSAC
jgi:DNA invertase Pin-like site-specific DNA recombinase/predicted RNA-binding Zn-ribbon protein involved in translation (DUF1610 family)